jgi:hypothetical protein
MKRRPGRPRALSIAGAVYARVELDDRHDPPPGKDWVHLDFQPGATAEEIYAALMKATAPPPKHGDDADEDDA